MRLWRRDNKRQRKKRRNKMTSPAKILFLGGEIPEIEPTICDDIAHGDPYLRIPGKIRTTYTEIEDATQLPYPDLRHTIQNSDVYVSRPRPAPINMAAYDYTKGGMFGIGPSFYTNIPPEEESDETTIDIGTVYTKVEDAPQQPSLDSRQPLQNPYTSARRRIPNRKNAAEILFLSGEISEMEPTVYTDIGQGAAVIKTATENATTYTELEDITQPPSLGSRRLVRNPYASARQRSSVRRNTAEYDSAKGGVFETESTVYANILPGKDSDETAREPQPTSGNTDETTRPLSPDPKQLSRDSYAYAKRRKWIRENAAALRSSEEQLHKDAMAIIHRVHGEAERAAYHRAREIKRLTKSLSNDELYDKIDKLVRAATDPRTGLLDRRADETEDEAEQRLFNLQRSVDRLWRDNQDEVVENSPRYIEGFPARQILVDFPPRFSPHLHQEQGTGLRACQRCLDVGLRCSRTFGVRHKEGLAVGLGDDLECRRCERVGIPCVEARAAQVQQTLPPMPLWYEGWMRLDR
ncbi:hypothetical protein VHEMI07732 [[Torrubiella] hemipterigena]|uniref:Uncharacterized protein n=1 Tax=[Torrubiella] hemipterigena TaxID=1531966 RepID=A0A0A1TB92_9HYPO|nr:hypothetical protein VHEMI07732 [[Torrubiella] hemipterigena]